MRFDEPGADNPRLVLDGAERFAFLSTDCTDSLRQSVESVDKNSKSCHHRMLLRLVRNFEMTCYYVAPFAGTMRNVS